MASSGSLMGFMNQLQNLELQMASILMETAMKLASMTDASVFMLVEHSGGRFFSGKRHLCDSYLTHRLTPVGNDVEMEVNPEISSLQERSHTYFPTSQTSPTTSRPNASADSPRKRSMSNHSSALTPSPSKRNRGGGDTPASTHNLKQEASTEGFKLHDAAAFDSALAVVSAAYDAGAESDNDIICEDEEIGFAGDRCVTDAGLTVISDSEVCFTKELEND